MSILELKNVCKKIGNFALKDVSFTLGKGRVMGFIGPNGSGKTTTIKTIMNLIKKDSGEIVIFGKDNQKYETEVKSRIGFVYDDPVFFEEKTLQSNAKIISFFYDNFSMEKLEGYYQRFSLDKKQKYRTLSKGMKMKFALAVALSHDADLIILDEPTGGLDPIFRRELLDLLYDIIQDEEKSVFFSTHVTSDLERIADDLTFIFDGKILFSEEKESILERYAVIKGRPDHLTALQEKVLGARKSDIGFEGLIERKDIPQGEFIVEKPTIEDLMYYMTRSSDGLRKY